jgi:hypothetical protein
MTSSKEKPHTSLSPQSLQQLANASRPRAVVAAQVKCDHYFCRCMMAEELASMDMLEAAIEVHYKEVPCRLEKK